MKDMESVINYIKSWFTSPLEESRKRRAFDDIDSFVSPKYRRLSSMSHSIFNDDPFRMTGATRKLPMAARRSHIRSPPKLVETVVLDDEDDVIDISKHTTKQSAKHKEKYTSTPVDKPKNVTNGDEDVCFVREYKSPVLKKSTFQQPTLNNLKPTSNLFFDIDNNGSKNKIKISPILPTIKPRNGVNNNNSNNYKHNSTLDHSFRLDDKLRYKKLLEQAVPSYTSSPESVYYTPGSKFYDTSRGKKIMEMGRAKEKTGDFVLKVLGDIEKETVTITDSDSDVEIVKPPSPKPDIKVDPVNSLKPLIESSETTRQKWLTDMVKNHHEILEQRRLEIEQYTKQFNTLHEINRELQIGKLASSVNQLLSIKDYVLPIEEIEIKEELPELTDEHLDLVHSAFRGNPNEILSKKFNLNITRRDILTLQNLNWLNDEVINFYMNLIIDRSKNNDNLPKVYAFNTFFYPKLLKDGAQSLRRWTRRIDLFAHDLVCIPVHLGMHWCMAIIDFRDSSIKYYDSMGSKNKECTRRLRQYLEAEHLDKKKESYDTSNFVLEDVKDIPQQMNGSDCGMFACTFAEFISRNAKITFTQENMPYMRKKMVVEIITGELMIQ